ncbi:MAG TPA: c-type cytochrome [Vicinamibacterales bacterium]
MIAATAVLTLAIAVRVTGQAPQSPPAQPPATEGHGGPPPPGAQTGPAAAQKPATPPPQRPRDARFPAHQRKLPDQAVIERGRGLYIGNCGACHGADGRGGQLGGPNLLRSQLVLNDQDGELIYPVVKNGRPGTLMPPIPMSEEDVKQVAAYLHSLQAQGSAQGGPPPGPPVELNILVGNAVAGASFFAANCSSCHSPEGDLKGIASRIEDPKALQNAWVSGGRALGRGRAGNPASRAVVTATVTTADGEQVQGRLVRIDDFLVTIGVEDGVTRTFRRNGDDPRIEIHDPLQKHRELLAVYTNQNMHDVTAYLATLK